MAERDRLAVGAATLLHPYCINWLAADYGVINRLENDGVRGQTESRPLNFTVLSAVNHAWPPLYSLHFVYPASLIPSSDAP